MGRTSLTNILLLPKCNRCYVQTYLELYNIVSKVVKFIRMVKVGVTDD